MKKNLLLICLSCLIFFSATAQNSKLIKGRVIDIYKEALIGVNIQVKGTNIGTFSDIDGKFSLMARSGDILVFSYISYKTKEVKVDGLINLKNLELYSSNSHQQKDVLRKWKDVKVKLPAKAIGVLKD